MKRLENIIKKLKHNNGESMSETLFALLIIALALIMLPGAVVSSSKVNHATKNSTLFGSAGSETQVTTGTVTVTITESESAIGENDAQVVEGVNVNGYTNKNGAIEFYRFGY